MKKLTWNLLSLGLLLTPALLWAQEGEHAEVAPTGVGWYVWFHLVNLIILLVILVRLARQPLRDYLIKRQDTIREALERAESARREAERQNEIYRQRLAGLSDEIAALRAQSETLAKAEGAQLVANARASAARIETDTQRLLKDELAKARYQLRQEAIDLAIKLAEGLLSGRVNEADQRRLAEDYLRRVAQPTEIH